MNNKNDNWKAKIERDFESLGLVMAPMTLFITEDPLPETLPQDPAGNGLTGRHPGYGGPKLPDQPRRRLNEKLNPLGVKVSFTAIALIMVLANQSWHHQDSDEKNRITPTSHKTLS